MFKHYRELTEDTHARWEGHVPLSHFNIGYWDGLGVYKVVNVEGSEEVVEITYDRKGNRKGKDDLADEMGTESFAVWYRSIGLLTLKEANHTLNTADFDANEERHAGDTSPNEGVDTDASTETSVVPHVHKKFILGNHIDTEIGMARPSTNEGRGTDHVEDKMECRRGQENVTKSADSFEGKAVDKERSGTPSDPPIMVTVRVLLDTADRGTIAAISPSTYTCIGMDSKDTVIMISTRTPNNRWGITFQFYAAKIKTMVQGREMSVAVVASEGAEITSHLDPVDWETSLLGSQYGKTNGSDGTGQAATGGRVHLQTRVDLC